MLPVTFVFGRPSRAELLTLGGCAVLVASAVAWSRTTAQQPSPAPDVPPPQTAPLQISSVPSGASVIVDGQPLNNGQPTGGQMTLSPVDRGSHTIQAQVRGSDGAVRCQTPSITFSVHQPSLLNPANPLRPR